MLVNLNVTNTVARGDVTPHWRDSMNARNAHARRARLGLTLLLLMTGACLQTTPPIVISDYCENAVIITFDAAEDTLATISEIRKSNAVYTALCQ